MTSSNAQRKCKQSALFQIDAMLENVEKEQQRDILSSALSQTEKDTIAHADVSSIYEGIVVNLPTEHLIRLKNKMYQYISDIFAEDLDDEQFMKWLCGRLGIFYPYFVDRFSTWQKNQLKEVRGKWQISEEVKQEVYDLWIENSIPSVYCRDGQQSIKISKLNYLRR